MPGQASHVAIVDVLHSSACWLAEIFSYAELPWRGVADLDIMKLLHQREKLACPSETCPQEVWYLVHAARFAAFVLLITVCAGADLWDHAGRVEA